MKLKNIKAAFFDLDGTLVSFNTHKICEKDIAAINKLRENGVKIFISSGRDKSNIMKVIKNVLNIDGFVGLNGNLNVFREKIISKYFMDEAEVKFIISSCEKYNFALSLFTENGIILNKVDQMVHNVHDFVKVAIPRVESFDTLDKGKIFQMNSYTTKDFDEKYLVPFMPQSVFKRWNDGFADINSAKTSKLVGINDICRYLNIDIADCISFGDSENDLEMIKGTGASVAMANASDEIKKQASFTTKSCDEAGAAFFIENYLL